MNSERDIKSSNVLVQTLACFLTTERKAANLSLCNTEECTILRSKLFEKELSGCIIYEYTKSAFS